MSKKLSAPMLAALLYYVGNLNGYSKDHSAAIPKMNTVNALLDRRLLEFDNDFKYLPSEAGIEALGGFEAIAHRKLAVERVTIRLSDIKDKAFRTLVSKDPICAGSIGFEASLEMTNDDIAMAIFEKTAAEVNNTAINADTQIKVAFSSDLFEDSCCILSYRFDELELIDNSNQNTEGSAAVELPPMPILELARLPRLKTTHKSLGLPTCINNHLYIQGIDNRDNALLAGVPLPKTQLISIAVDNYSPAKRETWDIKEWEANRTLLCTRASRLNWQLAYRIARIMQKNKEAAVTTQGEIYLEQVKLNFSGKIAVFDFEKHLGMTVFYKNPDKTASHHPPTVDFHDSGVGDAKSKEAVL
jgi:hypothetical protein